MTEYVWGMVEGRISGLHVGVRVIFIRRDIGITQMATHRITVWPAILQLGIYTKEVEEKNLNTYLYIDVHCIIIHNSQ